MKVKVILFDVDNVYDIDPMDVNKIIFEEVEMDEIKTLMGLAARQRLWMCCSPYYERKDVGES